jgi:hypothetical protein
MKAYLRFIICLICRHIIFNCWLEEFELSAWHWFLTAQFIHIQIVRKFCLVSFSLCKILSCVKRCQSTLRLALLIFVLLVTVTAVLRTIFRILGVCVRTPPWVYPDFFLFLCCPL